MEFKNHIFVGGSRDGTEWQVGGTVRHGEELRVPLEGGQRHSEVYLLESDGKYHFVGYGPPILPVRTSEFWTEVDRITAKMAGPLGELEELMNVHGYPNHVNAGRWIVKCNYELIELDAKASQMLHDLEAQDERNFGGSP